MKKSKEQAAPTPDKTIDTGDQRMEKISIKELLTPLAIIIAGAMIAGSTIWNNWPSTEPSGTASSAAALPSSPPPASPPPAAIADITKVNLQGNPSIGDVNAPVVMAYWFDYQCPFCKQEEQNVLPQLIKDYVDTGKLWIVFKDFQFLGPDSQSAGLAARAVWEAAPDKFREWHKAVFDKQDNENGGWGNKDDIIALTKTIPGIDAAKVEALMTSRAADYNKAMEADSAEGNSMGVSGTPSFVIGKEIIVGAQPYERMKTAIEGVLNSG